MFKNKYNKYQNLIYEIFEQFQISDQSICLITKNNQESIYIYNGLKYFFDEDCLKLFPETEVLPYDHFSSPERVIQNRFQIINEAYLSKNILITSIKNIFERYPEIEYFKSFETFKLGHKISVLNLVKVIESLDYVKKTNVEVINDYAVRGGIVDIFSPMYENPLRIEIFDDTIESIRFFDSETQLSIKNIDKFFLSKGSLFSLNEQKILTLNDFADLASDELTGGYDVVKGERVRIKGYLEDFALSKKEADDLIMSARDIVYQD